MAPKIHDGAWTRGRGRVGEVRGLRHGRAGCSNRGEGWKFWAAASATFTPLFQSLLSLRRPGAHNLERQRRRGCSQSLRPQSRTEGSWSPGHARPFSRGLAGSFWTCRAPPQSSHDGAQFCSGLRPTGPWRPKLGLSELPLLPRPPGQRLGLRNAIPAEEAAAAVEWAPPRNPSLIAHGPCHPHQLSHRRWGRGPAWAGS